MITEMMGEYRAVVIPGRVEHDGIYSMVVTLKWVCPVCGGPRGEPYQGWSYDGSRRLAVHQWDNPCGHIDKYSAVRDEFSKQDG